MTAETHDLTGRCHCGNLSFVLTTATPPEGLPVRACGCGFCRQHGVLSTSDPAGRVRFAVRDPALLSRYRFGLSCADFLICRDCGVYVGAVMQDGGESFAILNVRAFDEAERFTQDHQPMDYGAEDEPARRARRRQKWTPAAPEVATVAA